MFETFIPISLSRRRLFAMVAMCLCLTLFAESFDTDVAAAQVVDAGSEGGFGHLINQSRASAGLGALAVDGQLVGNARNHSSAMASSGSIYHNSQLPNQVTGNWQSLGENVGTGSTTDSIHEAFMASASHRANILGDYDRVGVGVVVVDGSIFVTEVFWKTASAPVAAAASAPESYAAAAPAKTITKCRVVRGRKKCTRVKAKPAKARRSKVKKRSRR